ncbi:hypothetical protein COEREDRAFT_83969 [Coemansia reversa NRRL 1564]|uniref:Uncharacterized protein n=1 Tax=Coemansia reversa (strain ATCC 12441 / NRRL 1564) TaxID=763665 RepID=A0A2G5B0Z0_COERN|nr:hypothetical protein COEREDRAFT_83969 [Coemansia reversa NRRL 1564]|eukprot:PIA12688.1 hypothetical protein COEREDRAFT_83969 [Coemansia reversa NRRL 1564]
MVSTSLLSLKKREGQSQQHRSPKKHMKSPTAELLITFYRLLDLLLTCYLNCLHTQLVSGLGD